MKAKTILECVVLYAKDTPMGFNKETKKFDVLPKHKTEVFIEDEIIDGEYTRPSSKKLKTQFPKTDFKAGVARFEVELEPYKIGNSKAENNIFVKKIIK